MIDLTHVRTMKSENYKIPGMAAMVLFVPQTSMSSHLSGTTIEVIRFTSVADYSSRILETLLALLLFTSGCS